MNNLPVEHSFKLYTLLHNNEKASSTTESKIGLMLQGGVTQ